MSESENINNIKDLAQAAAQRGEEFVAAVRANEAVAVKKMLAAKSSAAYLLDMFGLALFRLDLRLDDPREKNRLAPYDLQIEGQVALLELGVLEPLEVEGSEGEQHEHFRRLFGSSLLLSFEEEWRVTEVLPFNSDGQLDVQKADDKLIIETHQGKRRLPRQAENLDGVEQLFLEKMQEQAGRFNLEEMINALRLWRDFKLKNEARPTGKTEAWAAGVEYLITLFDYYEVESKTIAKFYGKDNAAVIKRAREIAQTLNVTQFDDRYSMHPDPVAHYRKLFGELGIKPERDEQIRLARERGRVFDTIEVPPDDDDFFGPE